MRFAELTLPLATCTANTNYDVFIYNNTGTLSLDRLAWSSNTARATALALLNGVYVKSSNNAYRYLGTIRITGTAGQCEDSTARRFVWNYYNRVQRPLVAVDSTDSWSYTSAVWRATNNNTTDGVGRVAFVLGLSEDPTIARANAVAKNGAGTLAVAAGIALDATNTNHAQIRAGRAGSAVYGHGSCDYAAFVAPGYHYLQRTELSSSTTDTTTWMGDGNPSGAITTQTGMVAHIFT